MAAFAALVGCGFFSIPFLAHGLKKENFNSQEKPLNVSAVRRGAYQNSGSRDVGVDKDWDFASNTWHGRKGVDVQRERALKEFDRERQQRDGEKSATN